MASGGMYFETATRRTGDVELEFMVDRMEEREEVIVSVFLAGSVDIFRILVKTSLLMRRHEWSRRDFRNSGENHCRSATNRHTHLTRKWLLTCKS